MSCVVELSRARFWPRAAALASEASGQRGSILKWARRALALNRARRRVAALALMTIGVAACSGEASRFNDNSYYRNGPEATGSIPPTQPAPVARVESQPLP